MFFSFKLKNNQITTTGQCSLTFRMDQVEMNDCKRCDSYNDTLKLIPTFVVTKKFSCKESEMKNFKHLPKIRFINEK